MYVFYTRIYSDIPGSRLNHRRLYPQNFVWNALDLFGTNGYPRLFPCTRLFRGQLSEVILYNTLHGTLHTNWHCLFTSFTRFMWIVTFEITLTHNQREWSNQQCIILKKTLLCKRRQNTIIYVENLNFKCFNLQISSNKWRIKV